MRLSLLCLFPLAACTVAIDDSTADFDATEESILSTSVEQSTEESLILCYDGKPCTTDTLVSGTAGNFCVFTPLPGGAPCKTPTCSGTCFPPRLEEDGSITPGNCHCQNW